jgi:hypothetical protein
MLIFRIRSDLDAHSTVFLCNLDFRLDQLLSTIRYLLLLQFVSVHVEDTSCVSSFLPDLPVVSV